MKTVINLNVDITPHLYETATMSQNMERFFNVKSFESYSQHDNLIKLPKNSFMDEDDNEVTDILLRTISECYAKHLPLVLSPDYIKLRIISVLSEHVNKYPDLYSDKFTDSNERKLLEVRDDTLIKGQNNDWTFVFDTFEEQLRENIPDKSIPDIVTCNFSTSTPTSRIASQLYLMDIAKKFYGFMVVTLCGIPEIILKGTLDDWQSLKEQVIEIGKVFTKLNDWITTMIIPILDNFIDAKNGNIVTKFWEDIFKIENASGSGSDKITGWIGAFYPFDKKGNYRLHKNYEMSDIEIDYDEISTSIANVPFLWNYFGTIYDMEFMGGMIGISQDPNIYALEPAVGWIVRESLKSKCSFLTTGKNYVKQQYYNCNTCSNKNNLGLCINCVQCHDGHELSGMKEGRFFCDCGAGDFNVKCKHLNNK